MGHGNGVIDYCNLVKWNENFRYKHPSKYNRCKRNAIARHLSTSGLCWCGCKIIILSFPLLRYIVHWGTVTV